MKLFPAQHPKDRLQASAPVIMPMPPEQTDRGRIINRFFVKNMTVAERVSA
ncbi:hypothetical protein [Novacetimonas hansenii]|uniref:hypothetical protein n=1 Tax=Novacetimonas hansenii TaxID=436 RepID=UPI0039ED3C0A